MTIPVVILAGKEYPVPPLVVRQLRQITPILPRIQKFRVEKVITAELYDDINTVLYWGAVWPNDKKAPEDTLMEVHLNPREINAAVLVIMSQIDPDAPPAPKGDAQPGEEKPSPV